MINAVDSFYSSPSQFSPAFSEPPSPWVQDDSSVVDSANVIPATLPANQRTSQKMEIDENLGDKATISSVLYANKEHPELKTDYPGNISGIALRHCGGW